MSGLKGINNPLKCKWLLGFSFISSLTLGHDLYIPPRIPEDFQAIHYDMQNIQGERILAHQSVDKQFVWFVSRYDSNLYVYR